MNDRFMVIFLMTLLIAFVFERDYAVSELQKHSIVEGCAHYDAKTGAFTWNQPEPSK